MVVVVVVVVDVGIMFKSYTDLETVRLEGIDAGVNGSTASVVDPDAQAVQFCCLLLLLLLLLLLSSLLVLLLLLSLL